jgi:hypothetical protein
MSSTNLLAGAPAASPAAGAGVAAGSGSAGDKGSSGVGPGAAGAAGTVANRGPTAGAPIRAGSGATRDPLAAGSGGAATAGAAAPTAGGAAPTDPGPVDATRYRDPGTGPWPKGTPEDCKMNPAMFADTGVGNYAVFRYGKLCHIKGGDGVGMMYSATKTLGGTMVARAAYLAKDVPKAGPGTGPIVLEDLGTDWIAAPSYPRRDATISHIMSMVAAASPSLEDERLVWRYDTVGAEAINDMIPATEKCIGQLPGVPRTAAAFVRQEIFDKLGMTNSSWSGGGIGTGWNANLSDMGKLGTLLLHDGFYAGEQLLAREWVYRMSHPNFENANTSYGMLAWLNHRGNAEGIGGNISTGSNAREGDPCAPAAFWPSYPHTLSKATSCLATTGGPEVCKQMHDVGVFSAQGFQGQFVVMHPGLDLVIAAKNFSGGDGPLGLWRAVRPGLIAMDPTFKGDEQKFCEAYGAGNYAPDLASPRKP